MLRRTLRISLDRANAQKTSVELPLRPCHELSESPELQAQAVARGTRLLCVLILTFVASLSPVFSAGADRDDRAFPGASLFVDVRLDAPRKLSGLKPGSSLEGTAERDVYSGDRLLIPAGSHIHLTVGSVERRRRIANRYQPGLAYFFASRHENFPSFLSASFFLPNGPEISMRVSLVAAMHPVEICARSNAVAQAREANPMLPNHTEEKKKAKHPVSRAGLRLILEAERPTTDGPLATAPAANSHGHTTLPMTGTRAA